MCSQWRVMKTRATSSHWWGAGQRWMWGVKGVEQRELWRRWPSWPVPASCKRPESDGAAAGKSRAPAAAMIWAILAWSLGSAATERRMPRMRRVLRGQPRIRQSVVVVAVGWRVSFGEVDLVFFIRRNPYTRDFWRFGSQ